MTQDERWQARYDEVVGFIQANHRNPSKYYQEDRQLYTWMKHQRKVMNAGGLKPERVVLFEKLLALCDKYRRVNQYV
jgi:hypothetical protein